MRDKLKLISIVLASLIVLTFGTVAFAQGTIYQTLKDHIVSIAADYTSKDSALTGTGQEVENDLQQYRESLEAEVRAELDSYEQQQIEEAKQELRGSAEEAKNQMEKEKKDIIKDLKEQIRQKIQSDMEKEKQKIKDKIK